jgi:hypothetical protein
VYEYEKPLVQISRRESNVIYFVGSFESLDMIFNADYFHSVPGISTCFCGRVSILSNVSRAILFPPKGHVSRTLSISRNELHFGFNSVTYLRGMVFRVIVS